MKKTGQEWLDEMPVDIQEAWKKNTVNLNPSGEKFKIALLCDSYTRRTFLLSSFAFHGTPEGHDFWYNLVLNDKLKNGNETS